MKHKDTKGTKTQRNAASNDFFRGVSLCLCALGVFVFHD
jgi:hypothetical protein